MHWEDLEGAGGEGGGRGIGMGNTCKPMAVSFQCMTKFTTKKKKLWSIIGDSTCLLQDIEDVILPVIGKIYMFITFRPY